MVATTCENRPAGFLAVPLNIRCSRKCASPDLPGVSSAEPTLYQIIWVTTGVRWSGITTTCMALPSVKLAGRSEVTVVWAWTPGPENAKVRASAAKMQAERRENIDDLLTGANGNIGIDGGFIHRAVAGDPLQNRKAGANQSPYLPCEGL